MPLLCSCTQEKANKLSSYEKQIDSLKQVIDKYKKIEESSIYGAVIVPEKGQYYLGDTVKVKVIISYYNSFYNPSVILDRNEQLGMTPISEDTISILPNNTGQTLVFIPNKKGINSFSGKLRLNIEDSERNTVDVEDFSFTVSMNIK